MLGQTSPRHPHLSCPSVQAVVDDVLAAGVLVCVHRLSVLDRLHAGTPPSLRLTVGHHSFLLSSCFTVCM